MALLHFNTDYMFAMPFLSIKLKVVDPESMRDLSANEKGELWIRTPSVMKGYLNNKEATDATIVAGGWLRTGASLSRTFNNSNHV